MEFPIDIWNAKTGQARFATLGERNSDDRAQAKVSKDSATGIVHCCMKGVLTLELLDAYERALSQAALLARRQKPEVLFLFDSSEGSVKPTEIIERLRTIGQPVRKPQDRLAIVVRSMP